MSYAQDKADVLEAIQADLELELQREPTEKEVLDVYYGLPEREEWTDERYEFEREAIMNK